MSKSNTVTQQEQARFAAAVAEERRKLAEIEAWFAEFERKMKAAGVAA